MITYQKSQLKLVRKDLLHKRERLQGNERFLRIGSVTPCWICAKIEFPTGLIWCSEHLQTPAGDEVQKRRATKHDEFVLERPSYIEYLKFLNPICPRCEDRPIEDSDYLCESCRWG